MARSRSSQQQRVAACLARRPFDRHHQPFRRARFSTPPLASCGRPSIWVTSRTLPFYRAAKQRSSSVPQRGAITSPSTPVLRVDLYADDVFTIEIPNCAAPIEILPDGQRALLSPTFCEEGVESTGENEWTNPDPVSIIDVHTDELQFIKNLPGFGPVALSKDGARAVAYLDMERIDRSMFDDPSQIPDADADRYHLMVIDPATLEFALKPIGDALPRFAMTRNGEGLLVDASVKLRRSELKAEANISFDSNGLHGEVEIGAFQQNVPFGYFDLETLEFVPFSGPAAALDRFVMPTNGNEVYTLARTSDGLGGDLFKIDLEAKTTSNLNRSLRDVGLLPDGEMMVLRIRTSPLEVEGGVRLQETYCLSLDGIECSLDIRFTSEITFESEYCSRPENYHDC